MKTSRKLPLLLLAVSLPLFAETASEVQWAKVLARGPLIGEAVRLVLAAPEEADSKVAAKATAPATNEPSADTTPERETPKSPAPVAGETAAAKSPTFQEVFAIYLEQTRGARAGGVLILHDLAAHPDWPEVVGPLRKGLPDSGWSTLSIQMPFDASEAIASEDRVREAGPRIAAGLDYLRGKGIRRLAVIGHGAGGQMALSHLAAQFEQGVVGIVLVGVGGGDATADALGTLDIPILDVHGAQESEAVLHAAGVRAAAARRKAATGAKPTARSASEVEGYRTLRIAGARHDFSGLEGVLLRRVRGWLDTTPPLPEPQAGESSSSALPSGGSQAMDAAPGDTMPLTAEEQPSASQNQVGRPPTWR